MSRYSNILLATCVALSMSVKNVSAEPKNTPTLSPEDMASPEDVAAESPALDDLIGVPDNLGDLDFGDPLPGGVVDLESDIWSLDEVPEPEPSDPTEYNALPEEELAGLKEFGAQLLRSLQANDPDRLDALPPSVAGSVDAIIADPSSLTPKQTEDLMQHFVDLGRGGYVVNLAPALPEIDMPVLEVPATQPILPDLVIPEPIIPEPYVEPFVVEPVLPDPGGEQPVYATDTVRYPGGGLVNDPIAVVGSEPADDVSFGEFFSVPLNGDTVYQVVRLSVPEAGLVAPRLFYDSVQHGSLNLSLHQQQEVASYLTPDDLVAVAPGAYDFVIERNQIDTDIAVTVRVDLREARDRTEPNDLKEQAVPITLPFRKRLFLEGMADIDWLTFTVAEEGVLSVSGVDAGISIIEQDGTTVPVSASSAGTRYVIIQAGTYFARVEGERFKRTGKVTLRFYPPTGLGSAINRLIGIGLENNEEVASQMRAVSFATGAPLVETTEAEVIATALDEASGGGDGWSWAWLVTLIATGLGVLAAFVYWRQQRA